LKLPHRKEMTVNKIMGSGRPELFDDYSVVRCLKYASHGLVGSTYCSIILLEIPKMSFFSCHLVEEGIQYIAHILI
jgi:hypothetical protein